MKMNLKAFSEPCGCGREHHIEVKQIVIEKGAIKRLAGEMEPGRLFGTYRKPYVLADENTFEAADEALNVLPDYVKTIILPSEGLHADNHGVDTAMSRLPEDADLLMAVGAGTIHDLTRYLAFQREIPFVSVPTAASVDGFVSTVAAMTWNGMKKTMEAKAPMAVYADTTVFAKAPYRLSASGISDLLGKYTALADWKIAHLVTGEYFCEKVCSWEDEALREVLEEIDEIREGSTESCEKLMYALLLSGLAMQMVGNSRPASGCEHHMSHLWEMEVVNPHTDALHGEKVSVGLLLCLERYEEIRRSIREGTCTVKPYTGMEEDLLEDTFGRKGLLDGVKEENDPDLLIAVDPERLKTGLPAIAEILEALPDYENLKNIMQKAGCCCTMEDIKVDAGLKDISLSLSPYVRRRLTLMRLSKMLA